MQLIITTVCLDAVKIISKANLTARELVTLPWQSSEDRLGPRTTEWGHFRCLIVPRSYKLFIVEAERRHIISPLPEITHEVIYSEPLRLMRPLSGCPEAPTLSVRYSDPQKLRKMKQTSLGNRVDASCSTSGVASLHPIQLFHIAHTFAHILCFHTSIEKVEVQREKLNVKKCFVTPCDPRPSRHFNRNKFNSSQWISTSFYQVNCSISRLLPGKYAINSHAIQLSIHRLRTVDLGSKIFCRLLVPIPLSNDSSDPIVFEIIKERLTSNVHHLLFNHAPKIESFTFDVEKETWYCCIISYLHQVHSTIRPTRIEPIWLRQQLSVYTVLENRTQPQLIYANETPTTMRNRTDEQIAEAPNEYILQLHFEPTITISGGLSRGKVELFCGDEHIQFGQHLTTLVGQNVHSYEPVFPKLPVVVGSDKQFEQVCAFQTNSPTNSGAKKDPLRWIGLHRFALASHEWLRYDLTLLVATLTKHPLDSTEWSIQSMLQVPFRSFGSWARVPVQKIRVLIDPSGGAMLLAITKLIGEIYDTGSYYCTGRTLRGRFLKTDLQSPILKRDLTDIAFGYRAKMHTTVWRQNNLTLPSSSWIHIRCVAWTSDPVSRRNVSLTITVVSRNGTQSEKIRPSHLTMRANAHMVTGSKGLIIQSVESEHAMDILNRTIHKHLACQLEDNEKRILVEKILNLPDILCAVPYNLRPDHHFIRTYERNEIISCTAEVTCSNISFEWRWIAGPIPPLTEGTDNMREIRYSSGKYLYLDRLPRSGTYIFTCIAQCFCQRQTLISSRRIAIGVRPSEMELYNWYSSEPLSEIQIPGKNDLDLEVRYNETYTFAKPTETASISADKWAIKNGKLHGPSFMEDLIKPQIPIPRKNRPSHVCLSNSFNHSISAYSECAIRFDRIVNRPKLALPVLKFKQLQEKHVIHKDSDNQKITPTFHRGLMSWDFKSRHEQLQVLSHVGNEKGNTVTEQTTIPPEGVYIRKNMKRRVQPSITDLFRYSNNSPNNLDNGQMQTAWESQMGQESDEARRDMYQWVDSSFTSNQFQTTRIPCSSRRFPWEVRCDLSVVDVTGGLNSNTFFQSVQRLQAKGQNELVNYDRSNLFTRLATPLAVLGRQPLKFEKRLSKKKSLRSSIQETTRFRGEDPNLRSPHLYDEPEAVVLQNDPSFGVLEKQTNGDKYNLSRSIHGIKIKTRDGFKNNLIFPVPNDIRQSSRNLFNLNMEFVPNLIILPGHVTVRCPFIPFQLNFDFFLVQITWARLSNPPEVADNIVNITLDGKRNIPGSVRFFNPTRVYAYTVTSKETTRFMFRQPPMYTLDISPLQIGDYGFYACRFLFRRKHHHARHWWGSPRGEIELSKHTLHPLCIFASPSEPVIRLAIPSGTNNTYDWNEIKLEPSNFIQLKPSHHGNQTTTTTTPTTTGTIAMATVKVNTLLAIHCETVPYRLFCELADEIVNGTRLIRTRYDVFVQISDVITNHTNSTYNKHRIRLSDPDPLITPLPPTKPGPLTTDRRAWLFQVKSEHWGAQIECQISPSLQQPLFGTIDYWSKLSEHFTDQFSDRLIQTSKTAWLNVTGVRLGLTISPTPRNRGHGYYPVLDIQTGDMIMCSFRGLGVQILLDFTILGIHSSSKITNLSSDSQRMIPSQTDKWIDSSRSSVDWKRLNQYGSVKLHVPTSSSAHGAYLAICRMPAKNLSKTFLLNVISRRRQAIKNERIRITIKGALLVAITPVVMAIYLSLKHVWDERQTQRLQRLAALLDQAK